MNFRTFAWAVAAVASLISFAGCQKSEEAAPQVAPVTIPVPPAIGDEKGPFVLRYFAAASGQLVQVATAAEVPEGARGQVLVGYEDPALHGPWLYIADLTSKTGATYSVRSVDRHELERQRTAAAPQPEPAAAPTPAKQAVAASAGDVVIFRTTWCGYCKKAAEYLRLKGVPFVEKDLENDPGAREDMLARAKAAGVPADRLQGVPILSVKGKVITGFDRNAIDRALGG